MDVIRKMVFWTQQDSDTCDVIAIVIAGTRKNSSKDSGRLSIHLCSKNKVLTISWEICAALPYWVHQSLQTSLVRLYTRYFYRDLQGKTPGLLAVSPCLSCFKGSVCVGRKEMRLFG